MWIVADVQEVSRISACCASRSPTGTEVVPARMGHFRTQCQHQRNMLEPQQHSRKIDAFAVFQSMDGIQWVLLYVAASRY